MIIKHKENYKDGYNALVSMDKNPEGYMDFGVISLKTDASYENAEGKERALLLIQGHVVVEYEDKRCEFKRESYLDENPICLHLSKDIGFRLVALTDSELVCMAVLNEKAFPAKVYTQKECTTEQFGKDVYNNTSLRHVRTVIDDSIAPYSNLVIGEVINFPGRWSSYPPHHHVQPEAYYYRIYPEQGFGISCQGDSASIVHNRDIALIVNDEVHPQVAAPGYAMYYVWAIPHQPKRWIKDRVFLDKDKWLLEKDPVIWPDK